MLLNPEVRAEAEALLAAAVEYQRATSMFGRTGRNLTIKAWHTLADAAKDYACALEAAAADE